MDQNNPIQNSVEQSAKKTATTTRSESFVRYKPSYLVIHGSNEDSFLDLMNLLVMLFSMGSLMLKIKLAGWLAMFFCSINFANSRVNDENRQLLSSFMLATTSLVMCYIQNPFPMTMPLA